MQPHQVPSRRLHIILVAVLLASHAGLAGCSAVTKPSRDTAGQAQQFKQIVSNLASPALEGRGAGTAGLDRARDDLVEQFKAAGLQPAFRIDGQASYTQPLRISLGVQVKHQRLDIRTGDSDPVLPALSGQDFNALGFSASGGFEGPLVFVGYGIIDEKHDYDSYRGLAANALRDKVAVAFRYEPQGEQGKSLWAGRDDVLGRWTEAASLLNKARWAAEHGAAALLVVNPPMQDQGDLKSTRHSVAAQDASIPVLHLSATLFERIIRLTGRDPAKVMPVLEQRANLGKAKVEALENVTVHGIVDLERPEAIVANVAGLVQGEQTDQVVVVGAHYDHLGYGQVGSLSDVHQIHPGADDNASGVAGLVLLAQRFAQRYRGQEANLDQTGGAKRPLRRSVLFVAFSGEERGLLGSSHFVKHLDDLQAGARCLVAMLNFDMIGRMKERRLQVIGAGSGDRWEDLLADAAGGVDLDLRIEAGSFGGSDHMSFLARRVPAIHFFTGSHGDYHRISDTADKINVAGALKTIDLADVVLDRLLHEPQRMAFVHMPAADPHGTASGSAGPGTDGVYLGVVPDYATLDGDQGCGLSGIIPASPAERGGLRADDVIIQWNDTPIKTIRGLTASLFRSSPGDEVQLQIRRAGKHMTLQIKLGRRGH